MPKEYTYRSTGSGETSVFILGLSSLCCQGEIDVGVAVEYGDRGYFDPPRRQRFKLTTKLLFFPENLEENGITPKTISGESFAKGKKIALHCILFNPCYQSR